MQTAAATGQSCLKAGELVGDLSSVLGFKVLFVFSEVTSFPSPKVGLSQANMGNLSMLGKLKHLGMQESRFVFSKRIIFTEHFTEWCRKDIN